MLEGQAVIVDFRGVLSVTDPVIYGVLESSVFEHLGDVPHRHFQLAPRIMVLLADKSALSHIVSALDRLQRELGAAHWGRLEWRYFALAGEGEIFRHECRVITNAARFSGHDGFSFSHDGEKLGALLHIVDSLRNIDLSAYMRGQPVLRCDAKGKYKLEFDERWIALEDLEQLIGVPVRNDPWKFEHLTNFLDFKVLDQIGREGIGAHKLGINMHCSNVLAPQFDSLIFRINPSFRSNLVIELPVADFLKDRPLAMRATAKLHQSGIRIALDGVILPVVERVVEQMPDVHFIKVMWTEAFTQLTADKRKRIGEIVSSQSGKTFVLCRCGHAGDIDVGKSLGFSLFQGHGVVNLLASTAVQ